MVTIAIKDDIIRVRVSKEQKELFKSIAKEKNVSMSEFMVVATEERALREKEKIEGTNSLELRVAEVEKKLQEIKAKMESQRAEKKSFLNFLKSRFTNPRSKVFITKGGNNMRFNSLNAEQGALLEQLELPEDISIKEVIEKLESLKIDDKEHFSKSLNEGILKSTIEALKIMI